MSNEPNPPALPPEMVRAATAKWASPVRLAQARQDAQAALQAAGVAEMAAECERLREALAEMVSAVAATREAEDNVKRQGFGLDLPDAEFDAIQDALESAHVSLINAERVARRVLARTEGEK